jgi:hypothetical protein
MSYDIATIEFTCIHLPLQPTTSPIPLSAPLSGDELDARIQQLLAWMPIESSMDDDWNYKSKFDADLNTLPDLCAVTDLLIAT